MHVRLLAAFAATVALVLAALAGVANADTTPTTPSPVEYTPTPPTPGALYKDGQTGRYLLGGAWLFRADPTNIGISSGWQRSAATDGWTPATVPNSWNAGDFSTASMHGSVGWYRRDFTLPTGAFNSYVPAADRRWIVRFESVNYRATVWLNGHELGTHSGAYLPFEFDLNNLRPGVNRLVVRVDDERGPTDLPPGPNGGWWNFGGLQREVYLRSVQRADLERVQIRTTLPCPSCATTATIAEQVVVRNVTGASQPVELTGTYGGHRLNFGSRTVAPHGTWTANATTTVPHPKLWAPGSPTLYKARLTLADKKGRTLGGYFTLSGIRTIVKTADGRLELNGRLLNLRGVDMQEQNLLTGAALSTAQLHTMMGWIRGLGADMIRSQHPLNPQLEEMADRDGILIWNSIPFYQVGKKYLGNPGVLAYAHSVLRQDIYDNQNHPSTLLWAIANELATPATPAEARYVAGATALAHKLDPARPVGMAVASWPGVPCQTAYAPLDVIGLNEYFGWFDENGGATDDRDELAPFLDSFRACYPKQAIMITEFGFDSNVDGPVDVRGTYEFQADSAAYHLGVFATKPWLSGAAFFLLQDFASHPGWSGMNPNTPDPPWVEKGAIDRYGNLKPVYGIVASIFGATQQIAAAPTTSRERGKRHKRKT
jgi:beta-glucuronidase